MAPERPSPDLQELLPYPMMMSLVYVSTAVNLLKESEIRDILDASRRHNPEMCH